MSDSGDTFVADESKVGGYGFGSNAWLIDEMYRRHLDSPSSVTEAWREFFADYEPTILGSVDEVSEEPVLAPLTKSVLRPESVEAAPPLSEITAPDSDARPPAGPPSHRLVGPAGRIADAMEDSLSMPTATSVRTMPSKLLEVNRRIINNQLRRLTSGGKVSFTHLIGWAVVQALEEMPDMNVAFAKIDAEPHRVDYPYVNLGLAVDHVRKDGTRTLVVPNIKAGDRMGFRQFWLTYEEIIHKVRSGRLTPDDVAGTTVILTNPGTVGTVQSVPRLMRGQGVIVGVGAIHYPPEYQGADPRTLARLGIGRMMTLTSTYDHRVIQGARSGMFLARIHELLLGEDGFYDEIFHAMRIPYTPARWAVDDNPALGSREWAEKQARVFQLINMYRVRGHLIADLDPLRQEPPALPSELDPLSYSLTIWDLDREFATGGLAGEDATMPLGDILGTLRDAYGRSIGVEYMHIQDPEQKKWMQRHLEGPRTELSQQEKLRILHELNRAEAFEKFLHTKYVGQKRFGLEGVESLIPLLNTVLRTALGDEVEEVVIGMSHRGRLNVLANIIGKSYQRIFQEFEDNVDVESPHGQGDVKYHLGAKGTYRNEEGEIAVEVVANPSHLEAVGPVLQGITRAKQERRAKHGLNKVLPLLLHGDAAFAGQGVVVETFNLSQLRDYRTGGTVHVVVNNQVGFTTSVEDARSSQYATDVAKTVQAPIVHVNADDPEAVVRVAQLAVAYRQEYHRDFVIDLIGYRRHGHSEVDEPSYTQPVMYRLIEQRRSIRKLYLERLVNQGDITLSEGETLLDEFRALLQEAFDETRALPPAKVPVEAQREDGEVETAVTHQVLNEIAQYITSPPEGFILNPKLVRLLESHRSMFSEGVIDWSLAEALAVGSLAQEGTWVRISGEDVRRGTFSHRHAVMVDYETGEEWVPLREMTSDTARVRFVDSLLSEFAALGFEYGYSLENDNVLVVWEAQFGDFSNGAQVIFDQFLAAGEDKWGQQSRLAVLLPHGYEGQGPDHSSARIERFLLLCANHNMRAVVPSTAAQYFHLLRRQARVSPAKPLIVFTPKSLLRLKDAFSPLSELTEGGFQPLIDDPLRPDPAEVERVVFCYGKLYYELDRLRRELDEGRVALIRIEELYPVPAEAIRQAAGLFSHAEVVWAQEEPENMGAWSYYARRLRDLLGRDVALVSRPESASPATGSLKLHQKQQRELVKRAVEF